MLNVKIRRRERSHPSVSLTTIATTEQHLQGDAQSTTA